MLNEHHNPIQLKTYTISCDVCRAVYFTDPLPDGPITIAPTKTELHHILTGGPVYRVTEPTRDEDAFKRLIAAQGWTAVKIHGHSLCACPACSAK